MSGKVDDLLKRIAALENRNRYVSESLVRAEAIVRILSLTIVIASIAGLIFLAKALL